MKKSTAQSNEVIRNKEITKMDEREHVLNRPETYIGAVDMSRVDWWVLENDKFTKKEIDFYYGFLKIFDELIVNASDAYQDSMQEYEQVSSKNIEKKKYYESRIVKNINVEITDKSISVWNDGPSIPAKEKTFTDKDVTKKMYLTEMIFGVLLTSTNYNDEEIRFTGGRNGLGAKLTNIYSKTFIAETCDIDLNKIVKITWANNMSKVEDRSIIDAPSSKKSNYVHIYFEPDLSRFKIDGNKIPEDMKKVFKKRVYDLAAVLHNVKITFNKQIINFGGSDPSKYFINYSKLYLGNNPDIYQFKIKSDNGDFWDIHSIIDPQPKAEIISFTNNVVTYKGGTHVKHVMSQIYDIISKARKEPIKKDPIDKHLWVFINLKIANPRFEGQNKEELKNPVSYVHFPKIIIPDDIVKKILQGGLNTIIEQYNKNMNDKEIAKLVKKSDIAGIAKLYDAPLAGTDKSKLCSLILTEGDSAKSLAMAGFEALSKDDRKLFGVFALKGKVLNVTDYHQAYKNEELKNLCMALGLVPKKGSLNISKLRYGKVIIMTDQDTDGAHIIGLILNFLYRLYDELLKNNFVQIFSTPLLKAKKGLEVHSFFSMGDFQEWSSKMSTDELSKWKIKYYKGLGTSTHEEAAEYFKNINKHLLNIKFDPKASQNLEKVFNKELSDDRKNWLTSYNENNTINYNIKDLSISDYIEKGLKHYAVASNARAIPSVCDGLKPGQRKILYGCFLRKNEEIKVAQLASYVALHSAYHHGENSLCDTIVNMAQDFTFSNNVNLLQPKGQFGTRRSPDKEVASARYIYTLLDPIAFLLFIRDDEHTLSYNKDDGQVIEPKYYIPIIPMVLVNGVKGIGTGWSTEIEMYNPRDIINIIRETIKSNTGNTYNIKNSPSIWVKGFAGTIREFANKTEYKGIFKNMINDGYIHIKEIPKGIYMWIDSYRAFLLSENMSEYVKKVDDLSVRANVDIKVYVTDKFIKECEASKSANKYIEDKLKLALIRKNENMVLFNSGGAIKKYNSIIDILKEFFIVRLDHYKLRKTYIISQISRDITIIRNKIKFIDEVNKKKLDLTESENKYRNYVIDEYVPFTCFPKIISNKIENPDIAIPFDSLSENEKISYSFKYDPKKINKSTFNFDYNYDYLFGMPIKSLTLEKLRKLESELEEKTKELKNIEKKDPKDLWLDDLYDLEKYLDNVNYPRNIQSKLEKEIQYDSDFDASNDEVSTIEENDSDSEEEKKKSDTKSKKKPQTKPTTKKRTTSRSKSRSKSKSKKNI